MGAVPVFLPLIGQAVVQALTKPWPWISLFGYLAISNVSWAGLAEEFRNTIWSLWPFVLLIIFLWFGLLAFRAYFELRPSSKKRSK